jgi:hypothetical protein
MPDVTLPHTFSNGTPADANQVNANLDAIVAAVNALDDANLASALATALGVTQAGNVRRGKSIIATEESRTNVAYGMLTTPDRVSGIVLPTDGLIFVGYHALWKESVDNAARAALFIGSNQLKVAVENGAPTAQEAALNASSGVGFYVPLASAPVGLLGVAGGALTVNSSLVTTGLAVVDGLANGGVCAIWAAAGTYDVSVQFKASSGSVTAKDRKLWVWTMGF